MRLLVLRFACDREDSSAASSTAAGVVIGDGDGLKGFFAPAAPPKINEGWKPPIGENVGDTVKVTVRKPKPTPNEPWEAEVEEEGAFWAPPAAPPLLLLLDGTKRLSRDVAREEILVDVDASVSA